MKFDASEALLGEGDTIYFEFAARMYVTSLDHTACNGYSQPPFGFSRCGLPTPTTGKIKAKFALG